MLNDEQFKSGLTRCQEKLDEYPKGLSELFHNILTRDNDCRGKLLLCLQWILFGRHRLKPEQLYFAIESGAATRPLAIWNRNTLRVDVVEGYPTGISKGLAEVTKRKREVRFIHETVKTYLLEEDGLRKVWPGVGYNFEETSHDRLKRCCLQYLESDAVQTYDINKPCDDRRWSIDRNGLPPANQQIAMTLIEQGPSNAFPS